MLTHEAPTPFQGLAWLGPKVHQPSPRKWPGRQSTTWAEGAEGAAAVGHVFSGHQDPPSGNMGGHGGT